MLLSRRLLSCPLPSFSTSSRLSFSAKTLVIGEHFEGAVSNFTFSAVTAAAQLGGEVNLLLAGKEADVSKVAPEAAKIKGVTRLIVAKSDAYNNNLPETFAPLVLSAHKQNTYSHIIGSSSSYAKSLIPRVAAKLDVSALTDVTAIKSADTFVRPIYAGNAISEVQSLDPVKVFTIRSTNFDKAEATGGSAEIVDLAPAEPSDLSKFESVELTKSERPDISTAKILVSGGRALKSKENFTQVLDELANKLGAALGASRAAVDAGYAPNDWQIGQTGKIVAPELYIAIGISGAIQHLAGMKDSKVIVAINKDPESPIFQVADYGLVGDLFQAVPELAKLVKS